MDSTGIINRILEYLNFFETLKFVYEYNGKHPIEGEFDSFDWQFLYCNDKDRMEFDRETKAFETIVNEFTESLTKKGNKQKYSNTQLEIETAMLKTDSLRKRIACRESKFKGESELDDNNGQVFCYAHNEGIETFYREYFTESERYEDVRVHDELLKDYSAELISIDLKWLKKILLKLQASLSTYSKDNVRTTNNNEKALNQKEIPTNYVSPKFQTDVVKELFRQFALKGWVKNDKTTKDSFLVAFSPKKMPSPTPKIAWTGKLNLLQAFIRVGLGVLDETFIQQPKLISTIWDTAELIFEYEGRSISKYRSDAKHAVGKAYAPMEVAIVVALTCLRSDTKKKV
jgi:hypothetical protein